MAAITEQQLEDASRDADDLEKIVNEPADYNGDGFVPTRYGPPKPTIAKVIKELSEQNIGDGAAALINQRIDGIEDAVGVGIQTVTQSSISGTHIADDSGLAPTLLNEQGAFVPGGSLQGSAQFDECTADHGGLISSFEKAGFSVGAINGSFCPVAPNFTKEEVADRDARAKGSYAEIRRRIPACEPYAYGYNVRAVYGQSLGVGTEAVPVKTRIAVTGAFMIGQSDRPASPFSETFSAVGGSSAQPLVGTAQVLSGDFHQANYAEQISWPETKLDVAGESILPGSEFFGRQLFLEHFGLLSDTARQTLVYNAAVGGQSISQLSKGASPNLYGRLTDGANQAKAIAQGASRTSALVTLYYLQGEQDEAIDTPQATYKASLKQLRADIRADIEVGTFGQARRAAFITYQTGGQFMSDTSGPQVSIAQWELSKEEPEWYMAAPAYSVTDRGGHLDSNGSRWLGVQMAKVGHIVTVRREGWRPVEPIRAEFRGRTALMTFHVPHPPLKFMAVPVAHVMTSFDLAGFRFTDGQGDLGAISIDIAADCVVSAIFDRDPTGQVLAWYASAETAGHGNLADSDPTLSRLNYEWNSGEDYASANVPELVGKPYPLNNFCIAFRVAMLNMN